MKESKKIQQTVNGKNCFNNIKNQFETCRYSDKDLAEFKELIEKKIENTTQDLIITNSCYKNNQDNGTEDTSPTFKPLEEGSSTNSKENNIRLAIRQEKFIRDLNQALIRIKNKTYGVCHETGKLIDKKRLKLVPHATLSIEGKNLRDAKEKIKY